MPDKTLIFQFNRLSETGIFHALKSQRSGVIPELPF
jgi:hypothetical protein